MPESAVIDFEPESPAASPSIDFQPLYETALSGDEEQRFQKWKQQYAPADSGSDYDLRGAFKAGLAPDEKTGHWPDTYKKPNHPTFSDQSIYAPSVPAAAGTWEGDTFIPPQIQFEPIAPGDLRPGVPPGALPSLVSLRAGKIESRGTDPSVALAIGKTLDFAKEKINEISPGFLEQATTSPFPAPNLQPDPNDSKPEAIRKAALNSFGKLVEAGTSPAIAATMVLGGAVPAAGRVIAAGFGAQMASQLPASVEQAVTAPTFQGKVEGGLDAAAGALMSAAALRHATSPLKSFADMPADLVTDKPATPPAPTGHGFLEDPAVPFMTKVRLKETAKEIGLADEQINSLTTPQMQELNQAAEAVKQATTPKAELSARDAEYERLAKNLDKLNEGQFLPAPEPPPAVETTKAPRGELSPEQLADEQYRADLLSEANAAQAESGPELLDAVSRSGGLPARENLNRQAFSGEIGRIDEAVRNPQRTERISPNKIFRANAPDIDELATRLRDQGFNVQTPGDLLNLLEKRLATGKPIYGTPATANATAYASPAQATLPRLIQVPAAPSLTAPRSLADIRQYLSTALDIPIRMGTNVQGGVAGAFGLYRVKPQTIRMKALNDIPTIAHEVGHDLHHIVFTDPATGGPSNFLWGFDAELKPLGRVTSKPTAPPELVRMEGVAEFTREWLTDRAQAIAKAPQFTAHFEDVLRTQHPEILQILETARDQLQAYINSPGWEKAKSMIRWDQPKLRIPWRDRLEKFYTNWFNELRPIDRSMNKLVQLGLDPATAQEVSARAVNYRGGWRGKADHDLRFEQTDLNGNRRGKSLHEILSGVEDPRDFDTYVSLKRAQEKQVHGLKTGFEDALADPETYRKLRDMAPLYETRRQELIKYSEGLMRNMEQSGFFTAAQLDAMQAANKDYVPFHRIYEAVTGESIGPRGGGDGMVNTHSGVMRFKGSDLQIGSPIEAVIKNTYMFRDLAERNRISRQFVDAVEQTTGGGRVAESVLKPMKPTNVSHEEMVAKLKSVGLGAEADKLSKAGVDLAHTIFRAVDGVSAKDGTFSIWKDGRQKLHQLGDEALLRALTLADSSDATLIQKMPFFKPAAWITDKLRTGATLSAEFIARNLLRDQVTAAVFSRNGFVPLYDSARGIFSVLSKDHWYRDWMKSGASHSGLFESSARNVQEALREVIKEPTALSQALELANPLNIIRNLGRASSAIEQSTRVAEYRRAIGGGKSEVEAANDAKDVTLNFSRHGAKGKVVNQLVAFFNAGLQDIDKIARAHREAPLRTMTKAFLYITAPSILAWYLGKDDKRIQNLPEWRKSYFWNVNLGSTDDPESFVLSVPKPFLLGAIYGTGAEKALDYISSRDPNAVWKFGASLLQSAVPGGGLTVLPTALKPIIENITNYSFFTGRKLINESQQKLDTGLQFNPETSETAKLIGPALGIAPIMVDNMVRGWLGGLGKTGLDAIDWTMVKLGLVTPAQSPAKSWRELPGMRAFFGSPYAPNEYTSRFYKAMDVVEQRLKTFDAYGTRLMPGDMKRYFDANKDPIVWYKAQLSSGRDAPEVITELRKTRDSMGDIGKAMVIVQNRRDITPEEKRKLLINLKDARDKIAQAAFDTYVHPIDRRKVF